MKAKPECWVRGNKVWARVSNSIFGIDLGERKSYVGKIVFDEIHHKFYFKQPYFFDVSLSSEGLKRLAKIVEDYKQEVIKNAI